jgi:hypothetical protein
MTALNIVRWPTAVSLHDHRDPMAHAGLSLNLAEARELGEALMESRPASVSTREMRLLRVRPTNSRVALEVTTGEGAVCSECTLESSGACKLGEGLIAAAAHTGERIRAWPSVAAVSSGSFSVSSAITRADTVALMR